MAAGINPEDLQSQEKLKDMGLFPEHSYAIIDAIMVSVDSKGSTRPILKRLVKLRTPWGKVEWNGEWGDESDTWKTVTEVIPNY